MAETNDILFKLDDVTIYNYKEYLSFIYNKATYHLTSQPYEPCLYISKEDKIIRIIHNSFTIDEIISIAQGELCITAITGKKYDINDVCSVLTYAIDNDIYETDLSYLEKDIAEVNKFYLEYKKYDEAVLDYYILKNNSRKHSKIEHQNAVIYAMEKWKEKLKREYDIEITYNKEMMNGELTKSKDFFDSSSKSQNGEKKYVELFLNPPSGCHYTIDDYNYLNQILFPNGIDDLEIYKWSTNWSNYFDDGLEWWGTMCVSIYDKSLNRFVVIGASATD